MIVYILVLISCAISSAVTSAARNHIGNLTQEVDIHERFRRQSSQCRNDQWQCRDGSCIEIDGKCDGKVDCRDKSDETHALCRNSRCQRNWFRCTYGACVDGTAPCNNIVECADQSDELLPKCRNSTDVENGKFRCLDGNSIPATDYCDGVPNCPDGSDETVRACAAKHCPKHLFQCAYGACVDQNADCNGQRECADGSDEAEDLCNKQLSIPNQNKFNTPPQGKCVLPAYPEHGIYVVINAPLAKPGQALQFARLNITCRQGYGVIDEGDIFCQEGLWSRSMPQCVRFCKLDKHESVEYNCLVSGDISGVRACKSYEPSGTAVRPECRRPNYYSFVALGLMRCIDGSWDYLAICNPECGRLTPEGDELIIDGKPAIRGELPWHAGIYRKSTDPKQPPFKQICGGSLVTTSVIISAAHCFWDDEGKLQPPTNYAVAVGKLFRDWYHKEDKGAQKSDVKLIHVPPRFLGRRGNFQEDIAIVVAETPFVYQNYIRPVCLNFEVNFNRRQLKPGKLGKIAGWGFTTEKGKPSKILKVAEIPYVDIEECISSSPLTFQENITGDKICAGNRNGTALCKGDSGGGLAFPSLDRGEVRYYLRGVVSTAPRGDFLCNAKSLTAFTQIMRHEHFINQFL